MAQSLASLDTHIHSLCRKGFWNTPTGLLNRSHRAVRYEHAEHGCIYSRRARHGEAGLGNPRDRNIDSLLSEGPITVRGKEVENHGGDCERSRRCIGVAEDVDIGALLECVCAPGPSLENRDDDSRTLVETDFCVAVPQTCRFETGELPVP